MQPWRGAFASGNIPRRTAGNESELLSLQCSLPWQIRTASWGPVSLKWEKKKKRGICIETLKEQKSECGNFQLIDLWQEALSSLCDVFRIQGHLI